MPFDVAGNFTRLYNFQQDRDNGIKILSARVDGEFDNFATGMNAVFFRDGRVPMQADLRMNINRITGIADGAVGSPALKFQTDPSTGPYLDGLSRYAISVNGVQRGVFTTAGLDVNGTILQNGAQLAPLVSPLFPSNITATGEVRINGPVGTTRYLTYQGAGMYTAGIQLLTDNVTLRYDTPTGHKFDIFGAQKFYVGNGGVTSEVGVGAPTFSTTATGAGGYYVTSRDGSGGSGQPVIYSPTANTLKLWHGTADAITMSPAGGTVVHSGSLWVNNDKLLVQHDGTHGYIRTQTGTLYLGAAGNTRLEVQAGGNLFSHGDLTISHAGNPTLVFAKTAGNTMSIASDGSNMFYNAPIQYHRATGHYWQPENGSANWMNLGNSTGAPLLEFLAGGGIRSPHANQQDAADGTIASGKYSEGLNIVGTQTVAAAGRHINVWGRVYSQDVAGPFARIAGRNKAGGVMTISASAPSGGTDGDIWFRY